MTPALDERDQIRAAMDRILDGARSAPTERCGALALEADVPRNALTQRHPDLKNEFYQRIQARGAPWEVEARLRDTIAKLKKTIRNKNVELQHIKDDVPALVRVVNQLTLENQQLREALAREDRTVIPSPIGRAAAARR